MQVPSPTVPNITIAVSRLVEWRGAGPTKRQAYQMVQIELPSSTPIAPIQSNDKIPHVALLPCWPNNRPTDPPDPTEA
jgi:hypothetical protein